MNNSMSQLQLHQQATSDLVHRIQRIEQDAADPFDAAGEIATQLGAHVHADTVQFGFWVPDLFDQAVAPGHVVLEILRSPQPVDLTIFPQTLTFERWQTPMQAQGNCLWAVVEGVRAGSRDQTGDFYRLLVRSEDGSQQPIIDPLANSVPYGVNAPAEVYDMRGMLAQRKDAAYFKQVAKTPDADGMLRIDPPTSILQVHVGTVTAEGTIGALADLFRSISQKHQLGAELTPAERNFDYYDAVQLMPIEPIIEYEGERTIWREVDGADQQIRVDVTAPEMTNWGYDVVVAASPAVNPVILGSKRPDELLDLIEALHLNPIAPRKLLLDVVYGHADNQSLALMDSHYFAGANMYGQNLRYKEPMTRAILLEMQRRKSDFGVDGLRVDGAQDFKWWHAETDTLHYDDDFLEAMNNVEQAVGGVRYRPYMIFEDGRPWPQDDWELASSYREVTKLMPNVDQWGPLTFAHNTPFLYTFWVSKWWRLREIAEVGRNWITGCANHDTLRRGTQVDPEARVNSYLGDSLPDIFRNAYDNPAANLLNYAFLPGRPMEFINALMHAPWSFIRNTGSRWIVKVMSEEARFMDWVATEAVFNQEFAFLRLKKIGLSDHRVLYNYAHSLDHLVRATDYNLDLIAKLMPQVVPGVPEAATSVEGLKDIARAWMDDLHDLCNITHYADHVESERAEFNASLRWFRKQRPWLVNNLTADEHFDYIYPSDGSIVFYGLRQAADGSQKLLLVANMEGAPATVIPTELSIPGLDAEGWQVVLKTPQFDISSASESLVLENSQGVVFEQATNK